jgi:thioredoxin-related protein
MRYLWIVLLFVSTLWSLDSNWSDDYKASLKIAQKENKNLYVLVTSATCRWCRKFEATTLQDTEVLRMLKEKYILVHLDRDMDDLPQFFKVKRVPKHYFVSSKGKEIYSFLGYWDELDFRSFLCDVDKKYKK